MSLSLASTLHHRTRLGVNVDHVATIRQARGTRYPDPVPAALTAELVGADQITVHLREDRRHIQDRDVFVLREVVQTRLNLEMAITEEMLEIALKVKPDMVTLVPERREERTTEGGLDVLQRPDYNRAYFQKLKDAGILVSLFIAADRAQIDASLAQGAQMIELHTGEFAEQFPAGNWQHELERLREGAKYAASIGLAVAAGHGLDYRNVGHIAAIPEIEELNIGHSIVGHALTVGFERAVREMIEAMALATR